MARVTVPAGEEVAVKSAAVMFTVPVAVSTFVPPSWVTIVEPEAPESAEQAQLEVVLFHLRISLLPQVRRRLRPFTPTTRPGLLSSLAAKLVPVSCNPLPAV